MMTSEIISGSVSLENKTLKSLTVDGSASLEYVVVDNNLTISGSVAAQDCSLNEAIISGSCVLEKVKVAKKLTVHGSCSAEDCRIATVTINGSSSWEDCDILGEIKIYGSAAFQHCNIKNSIVFSGIDVSLNHCFVGGSITIQKISWFRSLFRSQKIKVFATEIRNDIVFETPGGVVEIDSSSKICGKVVNGTILLI